MTNRVFVVCVEGHVLRGVRPRAHYSLYRLGWVVSALQVAGREAHLAAAGIHCEFTCEGLIGQERRVVGGTGGQVLSWPDT